MALPRVVNKLTWSAIVLSAVWCLGIVVVAMFVAHHDNPFHEPTWSLVLFGLIMFGWPLPIAIFTRWLIT
jgi:hypothetical protein